ncbi:MAG: hypothetical protein J07HX64_02171 [halophilic archaeon J07HX64]|nr:MAG: hypothetical protein J07HX64_02171 [halophilic archaeon J07HX64]
MVSRQAWNRSESTGGANRSAFSRAISSDSS